MNKRKLNLKQYGISGKRYKELCGFCEQYPEWKAIVSHETETVRSPVITDMPKTPHSNGDPTCDLVARRIAAQEKIDLIEETARQASSDLNVWIIKSVCYEVPLKYLIAAEHMPMSERSFYDLRRYFFYLLDKKKQI